MGAPVFKDLTSIRRYPTQRRDEAIDGIVAAMQDLNALLNVQVLQSTCDDIESVKAPFARRHCHAVLLRLLCLYDGIPGR